MPIVREENNHQKKYRRKQISKGLVRYELQVSQEAKEKFEEAVTAAADESIAPYSLIRRRAKARAELFQEMTKSATHDYFVLRDEIQRLKQEIAVLAPNIFEKKTKGPIPTAIAALPDDPKKLKTWLAQIYQESQKAKKQINHYQSEVKEFNRRIERYQELVDIQSNDIDNLKKKINNGDEDLSDKTENMLENWND